MIKKIQLAMFVASVCLSAHADLGGRAKLLTEGDGRLYALNDREFGVKLYKEGTTYYADLFEKNGNISMRLSCIKGEHFSTPGPVNLFTCQEANPSNPNSITTVYFDKSGGDVIAVSAPVGDVNSQGKFNQYGFLGGFDLTELKSE